MVEDLIASIRAVERRVAMLEGKENPLGARSGLTIDVSAAIKPQQALDHSASQARGDVE
jgi:hypothetical protein